MKKINILIIGFGSIGMRHFSILKKKKYTKNIFVLTKKKILPIGIKKIYSLKEIKNQNIKYFIICNETHKHFSFLKIINGEFSNKKILVEKPLFDKFKKMNMKNGNKIYVGYNLRFHPVLIDLKKAIRKKKIWTLNILCGSYLPSWRKNIDYKKSYSANKSFGGGALLDLSHELDYTNWIFGKLNCKYTHVSKISDLIINTEDFIKIFGKIKNYYAHLELNYFNAVPRRQVLVEGKGFSLEADLNKNTNTFFVDKKKKYKKYSINSNYTYSAQHDDIILSSGKNTCKFNEGLKIIKLIQNIKKNNG